MNRREQIETELLALRCQGGDAEAFDELIRRWQERLWRHAWRLTGDEEAAYDMSQEAWIAISRGIGKLKDVSVFSLWAYRIVSNKCRDWIRRQSRGRAAQGVFLESLGRREDEAAEARVRCACVHEALERLAGPVRAILSLRYVEGLDTAEVAAILDIPEGTVKSRLFHARKRLREIMEEQDNEQ